MLEEKHSRWDGTLEERAGGVVLTITTKPNTKLNLFYEFIQATHISGGTDTNYVLWHNEKGTGWTLNKDITTDGKGVFVVTNSLCGKNGHASLPVDIKYKISYKQFKKEIEVSY